MTRLLGTALVAIAVVFIGGVLVTAQITHPRASMTTTGPLVREGQTFHVGALRFTPAPTSDMAKFLNAKAGRIVTVTVR